MGRYAALALVLLFFVSENISHLAYRVDAFSIPSVSQGNLNDAYTGATLLFGGDVLIGRNVEKLVNQKGESYPFENMHEFFEGFDRVIVNFESTIPVTHTVTDNFSLKFSSPTTSARILHRAGIDIVSLGNNHSNDYGTEGFMNTRTVLENNDITPVGSFYNETSSMTYEEKVGDVTIGYLMLNLTDDSSSVPIDEVALILRTRTDIQIACVHWGNEYKRQHTRKQEVFAHMLVDAGFDAVIGHHPHVIQDIEVYKDAPIFYSLGNLVFDQYWDESVTTGYMVSMDIEKDTVIYSLHPYSSRERHSQPKLVSEDDKAQIIATLLSKDADNKEIEGVRPLTFKRQ